MSVKSKSAPVTFSGVGSGVHALALGTSAPCVGLNPCDPYCQAVTDSPAGVRTTINGDTQCGAPPGTGNLHTSPCTAINQYQQCQQDFRCNVGLGTCVWNGGDGYYDPAVAGVDLTIGAACESPEQVPICNRGSGTVPAGTALNLHIGGPAPLADSCLPGAINCSVPAPAGGLGPGQCINLPCAIAGNKYGIVTATAIVEPPGLCKNNQAYLFTSGAPGCAACSTNLGIDAGASFTSSDGGLTPASTVGCGDSVVGTGEQCDDGNTTSGDGCTSLCKLELGFYCPTPGSPCSASTCGNGVLEGLEQCDDGPWVADSTGIIKDRPYDGCYSCQREFNCPVGAGPGPTACVAVCGDGIVFPGEACDDGNATNGDGCSSTCTIEPGATCVNSPAPLPPYLDVPMIYRDFDTFGGYLTSPDFQFGGGGLPDSIPHRIGGTGGGCVAGVSQGIPQVGLSSVDREPVLLDAKTCIRDAASYATWYHDAPNNRVILGKFLRLGAVAPLGTYRFDSTADPAYNLPNINCGNAIPTQTCAAYGGFFPINGLGFGNQVIGKNYSFTSEVRFPFTYSGGEVLSFLGDDDMWVWIGGRKVVDIGNPHVPATGTVTLNLGGSVSVPASATAVPPITLTVGQTYEISVFHAERNSTGSNYRLTLAGFNRQTSQCTPPLPPTVFVRDFEAVCAVGTSPVWQLFRWQAGVPAGAQIDFRAATAATQAALPAAPPAASPTTVPIGSATPANSPAAGPLAWTYDQNPGPPITPRPVSQDLSAVSGVSQKWLRVYMTFNGPAVLYQWQQLFDCVPSE
jgi:fibro-slime domain-containing protein